MPETCYTNRITYIPWFNQRNYWKSKKYGDLCTPIHAPKTDTVKDSAM